MLKYVIESLRGDVSVRAYISNSSFQFSLNGERRQGGERIS